jgi:hypothetical protein
MCAWVGGKAKQVMLQTDGAHSLQVYRKEASSAQGGVGCLVNKPRVQFNKTASRRVSCGWLPSICFCKLAEIMERRSFCSQEDEQL